MLLVDIMANNVPSDTGASAMFLRKNWQIIYAFILIMLVPATIVLNTFFVVGRFRDTVDAELQRTALMVGKMFNVASENVMSDPMLLQKRVTEVARTLPEIKSLDVLTKDGEEFTVAASLAAEEIGKLAHGRQNILAWYDAQPIAYLTKSARSAASEQSLTPEEIRSDARYWGVVMPLYDSTGIKTHLLSAKISLAAIDGMVRENLFWSYFWLVITVLVVILVLASNTRLFQYASLYRRLKEVDQMKDDFISMASHELRAPITAIRGYLSLFLEDAFGKFEEKPKQVMSTTMAIATHLATLVEDLLDVSRIEQGRMKLDIEDLAVEPVIEELINQLRYEADKKGLTFTFRQPEEKLPPVRADKARIKQVLINLMSNAIKYTPSGSVTVTTALKPDSMLEIRVIDTGLGMSAEAREKLFQKFYRVRTTATATIPGTGLGLWITKQIVEIMGGRIYCDSIEKVGTQMSVILPIAKPNDAARTSATTELLKKK